jgi:serine/threonine-protein kinase RsbW
MDWIIDTERSEALDRAHALVHDHLSRHAVDAADLDRASAEVARALEATRPASPEAEQGLLWLHLDWAEQHPAVSLRPLPTTVAEALVDAGLELDHAVPVATRYRHLLARAPDGPGTELSLDLPRKQLRRSTPDASALADLDVDPQRDGPAALTLALGAAADTHPSADPTQLIAISAAALADAAAAKSPPTSTEDVADLFTEVHEAIGGEPHVIAREEEWLELGIDRCPFGDAVTQSPSLCQVSCGVAGNLASRVKGEATVVLDEAIAWGDDACRVEVWLGAPDRDVAGITYTWPQTEDEAEKAPPRLDLAVTLPRESASVPVVRRLAAQALRAFGVVADDISDVELAISEACANVIDHAKESDSYEVQVQLTAQKCMITVIDRGHGFEAALVSDEEDLDSEDGRGLAIMRAMVDNLDFIQEPRQGAVARMVKTLEYDDNHPLHRGADDTEPAEPT